MMLFGVFWSAISAILITNEFFGAFYSIFHYLSKKRLLIFFKFMPIFCNFWQIYDFISIFIPSPTDSDSDSIQYNISKFAIDHSLLYWNF